MWCVIWVDCKALDKVRQANIAVCVCVRGACVRCKEKLVAVSTHSASRLRGRSLAVLVHSLLHVGAWSWGNETGGISSIHIS